MSGKMLSRGSKIYLFGLLAIIAFCGINNYIWLSLNQHPPVDDEAFHLIASLRYMDILSNLPAYTFREFVQVDQLYPPLTPLVASLFGLAFGRNTITLIMSNVFFLIGTLISLYLIGIKAGNRKAGLLAALLLCLYPMFFHLSRMFMFSATFCFTVTAGITALYYSEGFRKTGASLLFGLFLGLGLLTKQTYLVFIAGPLLFLVSGSFPNANTVVRKKIVGNLILSIIIGAIMASWWYIPNLTNMLPLAIDSATDPLLVPHDIPIFSFRSLFFYLRVLITEQILLFFFALFVISLYSLSKKKKTELFFLCLAWIIVPYIFFTFVKNKFWYYTLPYLPAIALISAYGVTKIKRAIFKKITVFLILAIGLFQFFIISYTKYKHTRLHLNLYGYRFNILLVPTADILGGVKYFPRKGKWKQKAIIECILKETTKAKPLVGVISFDPNLEERKDPQKSIIMSRLSSYTGTDFESLRYHLLLSNIPLKIIHLHDILPAEKRKKLDFIVSPIELKHAPDYGIRAEDFTVVREFVMPDKSKVYLYKSKKIANGRKA
ncbi:MAG: glycosyltransferase family 39 protein [Candidatus Omnitrophota bacterium]